MTERVAYYFGFVPGAGHFLNDKEIGRAIERAPVNERPPWDVGLMDGGLLKNRKVPDSPDGRVHWVYAGRPVGWFAFVWWDRSGDRRGASNSGLYVRGFAPEVVKRDIVEAIAPVAFHFACEQWPEVVARQHFPLALQDLPPVDGAAP